MPRLAGAKMEVCFYKEGPHQFIAWILPEVRGVGSHEAAGGHRAQVREWSEWRPTFCFRVGWVCEQYGSGSAPKSNHKFESTF